MRVTILGCTGGIGADLRTTCLMLDHDILVDAGAGVGDLTMEQMLRIDIVESGNEDATMAEIWKAAEGFEAERAERGQVFEF